MACRYAILGILWSILSCSGTSFADATVGQAATQHCALTFVPGGFIINIGQTSIHGSKAPTRSIPIPKTPNAFTKRTELWVGYSRIIVPELLRMHPRLPPDLFVHPDQSLHHQIIAIFRRHRISTDLELRGARDSRRFAGLVKEFDAVVTYREQVLQARTLATQLQTARAQPEGSRREKLYQSLFSAVNSLPSVDLIPVEVFEQLFHPIRGGDAPSYFSALYQRRLLDNPTFIVWAQNYVAEKGPSADIDFLLAFLASTSSSFLRFESLFNRLSEQDSAPSSAFATIVLLNRRSVDLGLVDRFNRQVMTHGSYGAADGRNGTKDNTQALAWLGRWLDIPQDLGALLKEPTTTINERTAAALIWLISGSPKQVSLHQDALRFVMKDPDAHEHLRHLAAATLQKNLSVLTTDDADLFLSATVNFIVQPETYSRLADFCSPIHAVALYDRLSTHLSHVNGELAAAYEKALNRSAQILLQRTDVTDYLRSRRIAIKSSGLLKKLRAAVNKGKHTHSEDFAALLLVTMQEPLRRDFIDLMTYTSTHVNEERKTLIESSLLTLHEPATLIAAADVDGRPNANTTHFLRYAFRSGLSDEKALAFVIAFIEKIRSFPDEGQRNTFVKYLGATVSQRRLWDVLQARLSAPNVPMASKVEHALFIHAVDGSIRTPLSKSLAREAWTANDPLAIALLKAKNFLEPQERPKEDQSIRETAPQMQAPENLLKHAVARHNRDQIKRALAAVHASQGLADNQTALNLFDSLEQDDPMMTQVIGVTTFEQNLEALSASNPHTATMATKVLAKRLDDFVASDNDAIISILVTRLKECLLEEKRPPIREELGELLKITLIKFDFVWDDTLFQQVLDAAEFHATQAKVQTSKSYDLLALVFQRAPLAKRRLVYDQIRSRVRLTPGTIPSRDTVQRIVALHQAWHDAKDQPLHRGLFAAALFELQGFQTQAIRDAIEHGIEALGEDTEMALTWLELLDDKRAYRFGPLNMYKSNIPDYATLLDQPDHFEEKLREEIKIFKALQETSATQQKVERLREGISMAAVMHYNLSRGWLAIDVSGDGTFGCDVLLINLGGNGEFECFEVKSALKKWRMVNLSETQLRTSEAMKISGVGRFYVQVIELDLDRLAYKPRFYLHPTKDILTDLTIDVTGVQEPYRYAEEAMRYFEVPAPIPVPVFRP